MEQSILLSSIQTPSKHSEIVVLLKNSYSQSAGRPVCVLVSMQPCCSYNITHLSCEIPSLTIKTHENDACIFSPTHTRGCRIQPCPKEKGDRKAAVVESLIYFELQMFVMAVKFPN